MVDSSVAGAFSHIGLCVADIERACRFYVDALGFTQGPEAPIDASMSGFLGMSGDVDGTARFLVQGGVTLELLEFRSPEFLPASGLRPVNRSGFTHLSFKVPDVDTAAARIEACGGAILKSSRFSWKVGAIPIGELVFCTDPDGNRIELAQMAPPPSAAE